MYKVVKREPYKREREGFVIQQIGTHRIEWKIIPYQEFNVFDFQRNPEASLKL